MIGAMTARDRRETSRKHEAGQMTSIGEFGPWTSFRYFSFESQDEMEALAYRASGPQANNIVGLNLDAPGVLGNSGRLHVTRQGDWVAALNGRADKLEVRADGIAPVQFARVSQPGTEDISGKTQFQLSAAKAQALMDLNDDTNLTFFHQPVGQDEWVQFESVYDRPGHLPLGRLKEAIAWASAPKSPGF